MHDDQVLVGELVQVDLYDHRETGADPHEVFEFSVVGRVRQITDISISVDCWFFTDPDEDIRAHAPSNVNGFCIVKGAIKKIRLLGYVDDEGPDLKLVS